MISEMEVKAKADSELLEIWANQNDYVTEMVTLVEAEIKRRNLDTSSIHGFTVEEMKEEETAKALPKFTFLHHLTFLEPKIFGWIGGGLGCIFGIASLPTSMGVMAYSIQGGKFTATGTLLGYIIGFPLCAGIAKFRLKEESTPVNTFEEYSKIGNRTKI